MSSSLHALKLAAADADVTLEAHACNNAGYFSALRGDAERGLAYCLRALDLCRQIGNPSLEASTSDSRHKASSTAWVTRTAASYARSLSACAKGRLAPPMARRVHPDHGGYSQPALVAMRAASTRLRASSFVTADAR
jgi:hypothetical protein